MEQLRCKYKHTGQLGFQRCFSQVVCSCCLIFSFLTGPNTQAQTFQEWIAEIKKQTNEMDNVKVTVEMITTDEGSDQPVYQTRMALRKRGSSFHYRMEDIEIVNDGNLQVTINHDFRTISLFKMTNEFQLSGAGIISLDSILGYYSNPVKVGEDHRRVEYRVDQNNSLVKEIWVSIDKENKQIERIAYDYDFVPGSPTSLKKHVEMRFKTISLSMEDDRFFDVGRFFRQGRHNGEVQLVEPFQAYYLETLN